MALKWTKVQKLKLEEIAGKTPEVLPFEADTPAKKKRRKKTSAKPSWEGFSFFCKTYFSNVFTNEFNGDHKEAFEYVEGNVHGITAITGYRGLGKTTEFAFAYVIWRLATQGDQFNLNIAADRDLADARTAAIHYALNNNVRIKNDYPEMIPLNDDTKNYSLGNKALIKAQGIKKNAKGAKNYKTQKRVDLLIYDDVDDEDNQGNRTVGFKKMNKIKGDGFGALIPKGGRVIWLGNETHPNFAIAQYAADINKKQKTGHLIKGYQIFLRYSIEDENGNSRWQEQYSNEDLAAIREIMGYTVYCREMLGKPIIEGSVFKAEWFTYWEKLPKKFKCVWMYADPSWGEKGCYKAIVIIGLGYDGKYYMIDCWVRQTSNTVFYTEFIELFYKVKKMGGRTAMETVFGQHRHLKDMDDYCEEMGMLPISHWIKHINTKEDKSMRIERLETSIERGKLLFCHHGDITTLEGQFLSYPDGYLDGPDATAGAMERFPKYTRRRPARVRRLNY